MHSLCNENNQLVSFSNHADHCRKPGIAALAITVTERIRSYLDLAHIKKCK